MREKSISALYRAIIPLVVLCASFLSDCQVSAQILLETERFEKYGGWVLDTQFADQMGSPFLPAHGLGKPVEDAVTKINLPSGKYRVWARTRDWTAPWNAPESPGRFQILFDGKALETVFGTENPNWHWQDGGMVEIAGTPTEIALHDLTGFEGRCDAILLSKDLAYVPTNDPKKLGALRRELSPKPNALEIEAEFDLVVGGGGIAGMCAAVSAARSGLNVALIQDRSILGGANSSETRFWLQGKRNIPPWRRLGNVVAELEQKKSAHYGPENSSEIYEDERKLAVVKAEKNITLLLEHRVEDVVMEAERIVAVRAVELRTGIVRRLSGKLFADCTGDGNLGFLADADFEVAEGTHGGATNLWHVGDTGEKTGFPRCPWALDLSNKPFPGREKLKPDDLGTWLWQSGFHLDPILDAEQVRDANFRAAYGAWDALKNIDNAFENYEIHWMAYIMSKWESRRLIGDLVLTKEHIAKRETFDDGFVPTGWPMERHIPNAWYGKGFEGEEFIATACYSDIKDTYWVPYRCLYSRNIGNLFMAGRCVSVSSDVLGSVRMMRTGGCMGELVGIAASICIREKTDPRGVYEKHLDKLKEAVKRGVTPSPEFAPPKGNELEPTDDNVALDAKIKTSSNQGNAKYLNDAWINLDRNDMRWLSGNEETPTITFEWDEPTEFDTVRLVSGYNQSGLSSFVEAFHLERKEGNQWIEIPGATVSENKEKDVRCKFPLVKEKTIRLVIDKTPNNTARIWEIELYRSAN